MRYALTYHANRIIAFCMTDKIFDHWDSISELADAFGVGYVTAQSWKNRGWIPSAKDMQRLILIQRLSASAVAAGGEPFDELNDLDALSAKWAAERKSTKVAAA